MTAKRQSARTWNWQRHHPRVFPLVGLALVWCLFWGEITFANVVGGGLLGWLVLALFPFPRIVFGLRPHPFWLAVLLGRFLFDLVLASLEVAYKVTAPWSHPSGRITQVQLRSTHDLTRSLTAQFSSLVPGTLVVNVDVRSGVMTLHVFDAPDVESEIRAVKRTHRQEERIIRALQPVNLDADQSTRNQGAHR